VGQLTLSGNLVAGPPLATSDSFPAARINLPIRLLEGTLGYSVATGILSRNLSSPLAYIALQGVGPADTVTKALFLYLKSDAAFSLRLTFDDGLGGDIVAVLPSTRLIAGMQFDSMQFLKLIEAKGSAKLEYFVCGAE
jgi:hypothetical protein